MRIAFDIDGCLYRWEEGVREALISTFGRTDLAHVDMVGSDWNHVRSVIGDVLWEWVFSPEGAQKTLSHTHLAFPGAIEAIHDLAELADLSFITHRSSSAAAATAQWIAHNDVPFTSLHVLGSSDGMHLPKSAVEPKADVYVEDNVANVKELLAETPAIVMAPRRPYNVDDLEPIAKHVNRLVMYDHPSEIVSFVRTWM